MLFLLTALALVAPPVQDTAHLVLVATTDVHGHVTDWDYVAGKPFPGGLTRVATIVDSLRARYPGQVVLMDAGDMIQGDPFATYFARVAPREPNPVIEAMNLTGYDVATPGNHDFDWGVATLRQAIAGASFPFGQRQHLHLAGRHPPVPPICCAAATGRASAAIWRGSWWRSAAGYALQAGRRRVRQSLRPGAGAFADFVAVPERAAALKPANLDFVQAA